MDFFSFRKCKCKSNNNESKTLVRGHQNLKSPNQEQIISAFIISNQRWKWQGNIIGSDFVKLQDYLIQKWYEHIMETLKGTQWILQLQCEGCFVVTDDDIVLRPTNSNFNKKGLSHYFPPNIVSITIYWTWRALLLVTTAGKLV